MPNHYDKDFDRDNLGGGGQNDVADLMIDAEEFKSKGDTFYISSKFEQAHKAYEIARDLVIDHCLDVGRESMEARELKLQIVLALVESAYQIGWWEDALVYAQEGIQMNNEIARLYHLHAKALVGLENLHLAHVSLLKAKNLDGDNEDIQADIGYVEQKIADEEANQ